MKRLFPIIAYLLSLYATGQRLELDSLFDELNRSKQDTNRVLTLLRIGFRYYQSSPDSLKLYTNEALDLADKLNFKRGIANGYKKQSVAVREKD